MDRRNFGKMILAAAGGVLAGSAVASAKTNEALAENWGSEGCPGGCGGKGKCPAKKKKDGDKKDDEKKDDAAKKPEEKKDEKKEEK